MPQQVITNTYYCIYCGKDGPKFADEESAKKHEENAHDSIYVRMERKELQALLNFIVVNDRHQELLSESLMRRLYRYTRGGI